MPEIRTERRTAGLRFGLVASRFHGLHVEKLISGAHGALLEHGVLEQDLLLVRVPGAWEIPVALQALAEREDLDGLVALGVVIRGETPHFDYICAECAAGCARVVERTGLAVGFGVLTCDDDSQAADRAGGPAGNKGREAAEAALEMTHLLSTLRS